MRRRAAMLVLMLVAFGCDSEPQRDVAPDSPETGDDIFDDTILDDGNETIFTDTPTPTPTPTEEPDCVGPYEAEGFVGQRTTVCGVVVDASYRPDVNSDPTFLNFAEPFPDAPFVVVVWGEDRPAFDPPPEEEFLNEFTCVFGLIALHDGRPEIKATSPEQLSIC